MEWRGLLMLAGLTLLAGLTWWLLRVATPLPPTGDDARRIPDYYFTGPRIVRFDTDGEVELDLTAERAVHHPQDDSVALEQLSVMYRTAEGERWRMAADRGSTPADGTRITLEGAVSVLRPGPDDGPGLELRTERVLLDTQKRELTAPGPVELSDGTTRVSAVGLVADLGAERIRLESRVRGSYATR